MKRLLFNFVLIALSFVIQNSVFPLIPFLSAAPNLLLILTFSFGFIRGKRAGMVYGLIAGLIQDLFYSGNIGFYALIYMYIGYTNGICNKYYYEEYINLPLLLSVINELVYSLYIYVFSFLLRGRLDITYYFFKIMIPETIFTIVTTLIVYRFFLYISRYLEGMEKRRDTKIV